MKNKVAIIYGGMGVEHEISLLSAEFVMKHIDREKFEPVPVLITKAGDWIITEGICNDGKGIPCYPARLSGGSGLMTPYELLSVLCAFPVLHGNSGEDGIVQGALECAGVKYIGCKTLGGTLASDKAVTKIIAENSGIPTAQWILGTEDPEDDYINIVKRRAELLFGYPMFIKPASGGSSIGTSKISSDKNFEDAYKIAAKLGNRVIIEEALDIVLELECAMLLQKSKEVFAKIGSVSSNGVFYSYDQKYKNNNIKVSESSFIDSAVETAIFEFSKTLVKNLDLKQLSRIDFFLTRRGEIIFNEINTLPGLTESSLYPRLMSEIGIQPRELITRLITDAC